MNVSMEKADEPHTPIKSPTDPNIREMGLSIWKGCSFDAFFLDIDTNSLACSTLRCLFLPSYSKPMREY